MALFEALLGGGSWQNTIVTYSIEDVVQPELNEEYLADADNPGFRQFTDLEKQFLRQAFQLWSQASGLTLVEVPAGYGDIRVSDLDLSGSVNGVGNWPEGEDPDPVAGDIYLDLDDFGGLGGADQSSLLYLMAHEIGHALGLTHSHAEGPDDPALPGQYDNTFHTVMSYNYVGFFGLGSFDIQAIRYLYGAPDAELFPAVEIGTAGADIIAASGTDYSYVFLAGDGDDTLTGGVNRDLLKGENGDDTLTGNEGADSLDGGQGQDTLDGGEGDDWLRGSTGHDQLAGGTGLDVLRGNAGNDELQGGEGNDKAFGGAGDDIVSGGRGYDDLQGGDGNDTLEAGDGDAEQALEDYWNAGYGSSLVNQLDGGDGDDTLIGGYLPDRLIGGLGNDILDGGPKLPDLSSDPFDHSFTDVAVFDGESSSYSFEDLGNGDLKVTGWNPHTASYDTDIVRNVAFLEFADGKFLTRSFMDPVFNTAPIANDDIQTYIIEKFTYLPQLIQIGNRNDSDPDGDLLTARIIDGADHGYVVVDPDGGFNYFANTGFRGTDSFTYEISDGLATSQATVVIVIADELTSSVSLTVNEDESVALPGIGETISTYWLEPVLDENGYLVEYNQVYEDAVVVGYNATDPHFTYDPESGLYSYTPNEDFNGYATTLINVVGANGVEQSIEQLVRVVSVNDAPLVIGAAADQSFTADAPISFSFTEAIFSDEKDEVDIYSYPQNLLAITATLADGSALPDWLLFDATTTIEFIESENSYKVSYTETFAGEAPASFTGTFDIKLTATDKDGAFASDIFTLAITPGEVNFITGTKADDRGATALKGTIGRDIIDGLSGNDQAFGYGGNDLLMGGRGNDTLVGGSGDDDLSGGAGRDVFVYAAFAMSARETASVLGNDTVNDFANGDDRINVSGLGLAWRDADDDLNDGFAITQQGGDVVVEVVGQGLLTLAGTQLSVINRADFLGWG